MSDRRRQLHEHLRDVHGVDIVGLDDDSPLFVAGRLDSLGLIDLITFMEETWRIRVKWSDVDTSNLGDVARILAYADRQGAARG